MKIDMQATWLHGWSNGPMLCSRLKYLNLDGLPLNVVHVFMVSLRMNPNTFPLAPP